MRRNKIHVPMGACPPNPNFIPASTVVQLAVDTGPLPLCQALPCFGTTRRRRRR